MAAQVKEWLHELDGLLAAGDRSSAENFLLDRLSQLERDGEAKSGVYITILNELASFYRGCSRLKESEQAFLRVRTALKESGRANSPHYATALINLAGCYRLMGDKLQALEHYAAAREILAKLSNDTAQGEAARAEIRYLTASVLNNISLLYCDLEQWDDALSHVMQAADLIMGGAGGDHEKAATLNNLANVYIKLGRLDDADSAIRQSLGIYEHMPKENVHHAAALATFAAIRIQTGDYDGAETALERALILTGHFFGENIEYESAQRSLARVRAVKQLG